MSEFKVVKRTIPRTCLVCGKGFLISKRTETTKKGFFCSYSCSTSSRHQNPEQRFWNNVQKSEGCWIWLGSKDSSGYGTFKIKGTNISAHRFSWIVHFGAIPDGMNVLHDCPTGDNPACVNPEHLWTGTHEQNMQDMSKKMRHHVFTGETNVNAKLTKEKVASMRAERCELGTSYKELGIKFGVTDGTACKVCSRQTWKHVL